MDTGGFVALLVAEDRMHSRAVELFDSASRERWALVTTNAVVVETYSVLLARARDGPRAAIAFLDAVEASGGALVVERIHVDDDHAAASLVRAHSDKTYSLCDALSFVVQSTSRTTGSAMQTVSVSSADTQANDVDELALLLEAARRATWDATRGPVHLRSGRFFISANMNAHSSERWASASPATGQSIAGVETHGRLTQR